MTPTFALCCRFSKLSRLTIVILLYFVIGHVVSHVITLGRFIRKRADGHWAENDGDVLSQLEYCLLLEIVGDRRSLDYLVEQDVRWKMIQFKQCRKEGNHTVKDEKLYL